MTHPTREEAAEAYALERFDVHNPEAIIALDGFKSGAEYEAPIAAARATKRIIELLRSKEAEIHFTCQNRMALFRPISTGLIG